MQTKIEITYSKADENLIDMVAEICVRLKKQRLKYFCDTPLEIYRLLNVYNIPNIPPPGTDVLIILKKARAKRK